MRVLRFGREFFISRWNRDFNVELNRRVRGDRRDREEEGFFISALSAFSSEAGGESEFLN
jgi:hypothetical protein